MKNNDYISSMLGRIVLPIIESEETLIEIREYFKPLECYIDEKNPENFIYLGESDYFEVEFSLHTVFIYDNPDSDQDAIEFWEIKESKRQTSKE